MIGLLIRADPKRPLSKVEVFEQADVDALLGAKPKHVSVDLDSTIYYPDTAEQVNQQFTQYVDTVSDAAQYWGIPDEYQGGVKGDVLILSRGRSITLKFLTLLGIPSASSSTDDT